MQGFLESELVVDLAEPDAIMKYASAEEVERQPGQSSVVQPVQISHPKLLISAKITACLTLRLIGTIIASLSGIIDYRYIVSAKQGVLTREDIAGLMKNNPPLVSDCINSDDQLQPNGIDITVREISSFESKGNLTETNEGRVLSRTIPLAFDGHNGVDLLPGAYLVTFNEIVNLPGDIMALARPRSSLNRCGVSIHSAVWDAGYSGRSQSLMVVYNTHGFRLHKNARVTQLVFMTLPAG